jgi:hypothetical protein
MYETKGLDFKRQQFEKQFTQLKGKVISGVTYYEVKNDERRSYAFDDPRFDSIDYGLDLQFADGDEVGITWDNDFYCYGLSLKPESLSFHMHRYFSQTVTHTAFWRDLTGHPIQSSELVWSWVIRGGNSYKTYYPQDLILRFDGGRNILISALELRDSGKNVIGMADHITIFNDLAKAKQFQGFEYLKG